MSPDPKISVVICTRNRFASLRRTLETMAHLSSPKNASWELVVVDNQSTDDTKAAVEAFAQHSPVPVHYVFESRKGLSFARNAGLHNAKGEIIAFTDDDILPDNEWLVQMNEECLKYPMVSMFFGQTRPFRKDGAKLSMREGDSPVEYEFPCNPGDAGCGNNMIFRKDVVSAIGDFDIGLGPGVPIAGAEETDFTYRVLRSGRVVRYSPTILVYHDHDRLTPRAIQSVLFSYGKGRGGYYCKYILQRDKWAAKMCYWEVRHFLASVMKKGKSVAALIHLAGMAIGAAMRLAMETGRPRREYSR